MTLLPIVNGEPWKARIQEAVDAWFGPAAYPNLTTDGERRMRMNQIAVDVGLPLAADRESLVQVRVKFNAIIAAANVGGGPWFDAFMAAQSDGFYFDFTKTDRTFQGGLTALVGGEIVSDDIGEAMGLVLSQRLWNGKTFVQMLGEQAERVVNGGFAGNLSGWTADPTWSHSAGTALANGSNGSLLTATQIMDAGKLHYIAMQVVTRTAGAIGVYRASGGNQAASLNAVGSYFAFMLPSVTNALQLAGIGFAGAVDNVSVKQVPGHYANQANGNLKPSRQVGGAKFDGSDDNLLSTYSAGPGANFIAGLLTVPPVISANQYVCGIGSGSGGRFFLGFNPAGNFGGGVGDTLISALSDAVDWRGQTEVFALSFEAGVATLFTAAGTTTLAPSGVPDTAALFRIGAINNSGAATNHFGGTIGKLIAGRSALTQSLFNQIRNRLKAA